MKKTVLFPSYLALLIMAGGCSKDTAFPYPKEYPLVVTNPVLDLDQTGVTLAGTMLSAGTSPIRSYGFVWSWYGNEYRARLDGDLPEGEFTFRVSGDLHVDLPYAYQAFVETDDRLILGKAQSFVSKGHLPPQIVGFSPGRGFDGDVVTLTARNLSFSIEPRNRVYVQYWPAEILSIDARTNAITFRIPETEFKGSAEISLRVGDEMVVAAQKFEVLGPEITGISTTAGFPGDELKISGVFHASGAGATQVFFGSSEAKVTQVAQDELTAIVPVSYNALADVESEVRVLKGQKTAVSPQLYRTWKTWAQKTPPPFDHNRRYQAFSYEGKGYILEMNGKKLYSYDPATDRWATVSSYPGMVAEGHLPIVHGSKLLALVGGGGSSGQIWEYDFAARQWRRKADMPFSFSWATGVRRDQEWYIFADDRSVWTFDPARETFLRKNDFPAVFNRFAFPFVQDGEIMLITYEKNWQYETTTDSWTARSTNNFVAFPYGQDFPYEQETFGFVHKGAAYVFDNGAYLYRYYPALAEWRPVSLFPGCSGYGSYKTVFTANGTTYAASFRKNNDAGCPPQLLAFLN